MKSAGKSLLSLEKYLHFSICCKLNLYNGVQDQNQLFCRYLVQQTLHQIMAKQFYTNLSIFSQDSIFKVEENQYFNT